MRRLFFLFILFAACSSPTFPELPKGAYVGQISGIIQGSDRSFSLYAEQLGKDGALLFVVLADGWSPQIIEKQKNTAGAKRGPLSLNHENVRYSLTGSESSGGFSGEVTAGSGRLGQWNLSPISSSELKKQPGGKLSGFDLSEWLATKVRYNILRDEIESLKISHEEQSEKADKLERFVKNENVLKDRSRSRKDALTDELNRITEMRKKNTQDLREALNDLTLLHRMTREGQLVELNRRIARRENKWYNINWSSEGDPESLEEQLAEQAQVDLTKLNVAVRRAEEVERLQASITAEQMRIEQLDTALQQRIRTIERPDVPPQRTPPPTNERKPWWRVWDNFSG